MNVLKDEDTLQKLAQLNNAVSIIGNIVGLKKQFQPSFLNYKNLLADEFKTYSNLIKPSIKQDNVADAKQTQQFMQTQKANWVMKNCRFAEILKKG